MAAASYVFGICVALLCGVLLARGYRQSRQRLLLWSSICFLGIALHSALMFVDVVLLPNTDLHLVRRSTMGVSLLVLIFGLIWETQ